MANIWPYAVDLQCLDSFFAAQIFGAARLHPQARRQSASDRNVFVGDLKRPKDILTEAVSPMLDRPLINFAKDCQSWSKLCQQLARFRSYRQRFLQFNMI